jgi:hypothetical protein
MPHGAEDVRLLSFSQDRRGWRYYDLKDAADRLEVRDMNNEGWILDGPSITAFRAVYMAHRGGAIAHHSSLLAKGGIDWDDSMRLDDEPLCCPFQTAVQVDHMHISRSVSLELVCHIEVLMLKEDHKPAVDRTYLAGAQGPPKGE